jgi:hypothetical protein
MGLLDILFKIYFSPLKSYEIKGRLVATYWLCMPLGFISLGMFNALTFSIRKITNFNFMLHPLILGGVGLFLTIGWQIFLDRLYVREGRELGALLHAGLAVLLLFAFLFFAIGVISLSYIFLWKV